MVDKTAIKNALGGKSWTLNLNGLAAILVPVIIMAARRYGIELTPEEATVVTTAIFTILNTIMRFVTTTAMSDK